MLTRWDPFREMVSMRRAMDRLIDSSFSDGNNWQQMTEWALPLDVVEHEDEYLVKASLPGINPDDVNISVQENVVTIQGETKQEDENKEQRWHMRERRWGSFSRSFTLPAGVDANNVQAEYENGVLSLTLPKSQEAKPKRISIKGSGQKTIEGHSTSVGVGHNRQ